jgi:sterol desaturase/sphingolipid hydroxylase (fatty acid hydroxylase superfamily)
MLKLPSWNSIMNFCTTNLLILGVGTLDFINYSFYQNEYIYPFTLCRNEIFLYTIDYFVKDHPNIQLEDRRPKESFPFEFQYNVVVSSAIESFTSLLIQLFWFSHRPEALAPAHFVGVNENVMAGTRPDGPWNDIIYLIPISFIFELIFDFFHYWSHRMLHEYPLLYRQFHKKHHQYQQPNVWITFHQHPMDLFFTNLCPTLITFWIMKRYICDISLLQWKWINTYKTYIEICGHTGKDIPKTCGFPQCIWIPKILKIELYTKDHDRHHSENNCNYSKRFIIWDKIFRTFRNEKKTNTHPKEE